MEPGQLQSGNSAEGRNRRETLPPWTYAKSCLSLYEYAFRPVCLRLSMDTHDGWHNSPFLNQVFKPNETPDPVKLQEGSVTMRSSISSVAHQFDDWHGRLVGISLKHRLRLDGWCGRLTCGSARGDTQKRRRLCNTMVVCPSVLARHHFWISLFVLRQVGWPSDHASSPNTFSALNIYILPDYYVLFRLQKSLGKLRYHIPRFTYLIPTNCVFKCSSSVIYSSFTSFRQLKYTALNYKGPASIPFLDTVQSSYVSKAIYGMLSRLIMTPKKTCRSRAWRVNIWTNPHRPEFTYLNNWCDVSVVCLTLCLTTQHLNRRS